MNHLIHVRADNLPKAIEKQILADAARYNGKLDDVTDKGALFVFPTLGAAELFRDRVNANYSRAHADHIESSR